MVVQNAIGCQYCWAKLGDGFLKVCHTSAQVVAAGLEPGCGPPIGRGHLLPTGVDELRNWAPRLAFVVNNGPNFL